MPTLTMRSHREHGTKIMSVSVEDLREAEKLVTGVLKLGNSLNPGEFSLSYILAMGLFFLDHDGSESFTYETGRKFPEGFVKETISYEI